MARSQVKEATRQDKIQIQDTDTHKHSEQKAIIFITIELRGFSSGMALYAYSYMYDMRISLRNCEHQDPQSSCNASEIIIYAFTFAELYAVSTEQCDVLMQNAECRINVTKWLLLHPMGAVHSIAHRYKYK